MKFDEYHIIEKAIMDGVRYGLRRWNKYDNQPEIPDDKVDELACYLTDYITSELCEWVRFEGGAIDG